MHTLQSATDLPGLSWAIDTALAAGVVRRHRGKLVAVAGFAGLDDLSAFEKLVPAGLDAGRRPSGFLGEAFASVLDALDDVTYVQLFQLLDRGPAGAGVDELLDLGGGLVPLLAVEAVRPHLGGPHDGPVLNWLIGREAIDPASVDPVRLFRGSVDMMAAALDAMGPPEVAAVFGKGTHEQTLELVESLWRLDHPRLAEVLDAIGAHHPTKAVAKAARKALVKHRSMLADQRSRRG